MRAYWAAILSPGTSQSAMGRGHARSATLVITLATRSLTAPVVSLRPGLFASQPCSPSREKRT